MDGDRNFTDSGDRVGTGGNERGAHEREVHRYSIGEDETPSEAVTYALMDGADDAPLEQQTPLYDVVDPDALDDLFRTDRNFDDGGASGRVTFKYEGYDVTVRADGEIVLRDTE